MDDFKRFFSTFLLALGTYLILTFAAGVSIVEGTPLWGYEQLVLAFSVALIVASVTSHILCRKDDFRMLNPVRWGIMLVYLIPLFIEMVKANFDVAYRVITGNIRPGIVRIKPGLEKDLSITLLANSITLTPGTLTVDVDEDKKELYIHWIKVRKNPTETISGRFTKWIRRFAE